MTSIIFASIILSIVIINILIGLQVRAKKNYYFSLYNAERTKSHFAKTRNELMHMAVNSQIDTKSDLFIGLYKLHTFIMRNPDSYSDFSREFTSALLNIKKKNTRELTDSEKKISYMTAEALGHIVINYSSIMRLLYKLINHISYKSMDGAKFVVFLMHIGHLENKIKAEKEIRKTQQELYKMSDSRNFIPC